MNKSLIILFVVLTTACHNSKSLPPKNIGEILVDPTAQFCIKEDQFIIMEPYPEFTRKRVYEWSNDVDSMELVLDEKMDKSDPFINKNVFCIDSIGVIIQIT